MSDKRTLRHAEESARELAPWLPRHVDNYLDIGCGSGIVTGVIADAVGANVTHVVDGDGSIVDPKSFNGYGPAVTAWGDVHAAAARLRFMGCKVFAYVAPELPLHAPIDLVTSFLSWGHHYPLGTYIDAVAKLLCHDGRLIMDWRRGHRVDHDAWRAMMARRHFVELGVVRERPKYIRVVWAKRTKR